jgi:hypothetical protein
MVTTMARRIRGAGVKALRLPFDLARGLFRRTSATAEMLSDAGHGPEPWREDSEFESPYAGVGPVAEDDSDRHPA